MDLYLLIVHLIILILVFIVILLYVLLRKKREATCYDKVNRFDRKLCFIHERLDNLEEDIDSLD